MPQTDQNDAMLTQLFIEVASVKLMLHAAIRGILPIDQAEAWGEIEAMITHIEGLAKVGKVEGTKASTNREINKRAAANAAAFLRTIGPPLQRN